MSTAQALIEAGYARSTANDAGKLASDGELLLHLNRKYQSLYAIMALSMTAATTRSRKRRSFWPGARRGGAARRRHRHQALEQLSAAQRRTSSQPTRRTGAGTWLPRFYRQGNSLVSRGSAGDLGPGELNVYHLDAPAALSTLSFGY
jgi:hypothetical protein